jgi:molybdate transport system ATP-binding protein
MTQIEPLIELRNVSVVLNGNAILRDLSWQLGREEHWAISGRNGSGKSTFLKLIRGEIWPSPGKGERICRIAGLEKETALALKQRVAIVSPELQDRYLQEEWRLTALQVVYSGFLNGDYLYERPTAKQKEFAATVIDVLGIGPLLRRNVQQLSTGELRKVLIARALAGKPFILALDEVCDGLDASARRDLLGRLEQIARSGTQIVFATHRREELFAAITHELVLEKGRMVSSGRRRECDAASGVRESPPLPFPAVRTGESGRGLAHA